MNTSATKTAGRKPKAVDKDVAIMMLESALAYCQESGIEVSVANGKFRIIVDVIGLRAETIDGQTQFFLAEPTTILATATQPMAAPSASLPSSA